MFGSSYYWTSNCFLYVYMVVGSCLVFDIWTVPYQVIENIILHYMHGVLNFKSQWFSMKLTSMKWRHILAYIINYNRPFILKALQKTIWPTWSFQQKDIHQKKKKKQKDQRRVSNLVYLVSTTCIDINHPKRKKNDKNQTNKAFKLNKLVNFMRAKIAGKVIFSLTRKYLGLR